MLEACGGYFCAAATRPRLMRFLVHLQRYVKSKSMDVDVTFSVLDLLDDMDEGIKRACARDGST